MYALLLAAAVIPPALLVVALAWSLGRPLSWPRLALVFGLGAALLMPVYGLLDVHDWLGVELGNDPYPKGLYRGFVLASLPEELCRFFLTWACAAWCMRGREAGGAFAPAIVCGVAVMLGFASLENCVYVYNRGWDVLPARTLTAIPFNAALGVVLGASVGAALSRTRARGAWLLGALALTVALHGAYDAPLLILYETNHKATAAETAALVSASYVVFGATLLAALLLVIRARRRLPQGSTTSA